jgi:hypothetical protein
MRKNLHFIGLLLGLLALGCAGGRYQTEDYSIRERGSQIVIRSRAPFPPEVTSKTQAMSICRDAAIALGQGHLLNYVLEKKTKSGQQLEDYEEAYIKLQRRIRGTVKEANVLETKWSDEDCWVTLSISKKKVRAFLQEVEKN